MVVRQDIEKVENVIEDEANFPLKVLDQELGPLTMFTIHLMSEHWKRIVRSQRRKRWDEGREVWRMSLR